MALPQQLYNQQQQYPQLPPTQGDEFWEFLFGSPERLTNVPRFAPQQQSALNQLLQGSMAGLGSLKPSFEPFRQQALGTFQEQIVPSLAERFTSLGGSGTRLGSSGFGQAIGSAGAGLSRDLEAQEQQYNMQQQDFLRMLLGMALQPQYESLYRPEQPGFLQQALMSAAPDAAKAIASGIKMLPFLF